MESNDRNVAGDGNQAVSRRRYLGGVAAVAAVSAAGCQGLLGGGSGPEATVREFYTALDEGDADTMNDLMHPDAGGAEVTDQQAQALSQADITIENVEVLEEGDEQATVEIEVTMSMMGEEATETSEVELRTHEGDWKIYG